MNNECIICFDSIDIENQNIYLFKDCQHNNYHIDCINNWIKNCMNKNIPPSCPVCAKEYIQSNNDEPVCSIYNQKYYGVYIISISISIIIIIGWGWIK